MVLVIDEVLLPFGVRPSPDLVSASSCVGQVALDVAIHLLTASILRQVMNCGKLPSQFLAWQELLPRLHITRILTVVVDVELVALEVGSKPSDVELLLRSSVLVTR